MGVGSGWGFDFDAGEEGAEGFLFVFHFGLAGGFDVCDGEVGEVGVDAAEEVAHDGDVFEGAAAVKLDGFFEHGEAFFEPFGVEGFDVEGEVDVVLAGYLFAGDGEGLLSAADDAGDLEGAHELLVEREDFEDHFPHLDEEAEDEVLAVDLELFAGEVGVVEAEEVGDVPVDGAFDGFVPLVVAGEAHEVDLVSGVVAADGGDGGAGGDVVGGEAVASACGASGGGADGGEGVQFDAGDAGVPIRLQFHLVGDDLFGNAVVFPEGAGFVFAAEGGEAAAFVVVVGDLVDGDEGGAVGVGDFWPHDDFMEGGDVVFVDATNEDAEDGVLLVDLLPLADVAVPCPASFEEAAGFFLEASEFLLDGGLVDAGAGAEAEELLDEVGVPAFVPFFGEEVGFPEVFLDGDPGGVFDVADVPGVEDVKAGHVGLDGGASGLFDGEAEGVDAFFAEAGDDFADALFGEGGVFGGDEFDEGVLAEVFVHEVAFDDDEGVFDDADFVLGFGRGDEGGVDAAFGLSLGLRCLELLLDEDGEVFDGDGFEAGGGAFAPEGAEDGVAVGFRPVDGVVQFLPEFGEEALFDFVVKEGLDAAG